jgi:Molecular chaperone (small heat shock protein)
MATKSMMPTIQTPSLFTDFFTPWNEWFDNGSLMERTLTIPAVNVKENGDHYSISLAAPGLKKEDFNIRIEGNLLTISSEKEEKTEQKEERFTRKEYSFSSFSRSFNLPDDVKQDNINAHYENGVLNIQLPRKEENKKIFATRKIAIK